MGSMLSTKTQRKGVETDRREEERRKNRPNGGKGMFFGFG
jgi:hypothetical protein